MIVAIQTIDNLADGTKAQIGNNRWVIARPINYKYRGLAERVKDAWAVFIGKADAVKYMGQ